LINQRFIYASRRSGRIMSLFADDGKPFFSRTDMKRFICSLEHQIAPFRRHSGRRRGGASRPHEGVSRPHPLILPSPLAPKRSLSGSRINRP